jgi:hypothetical protein
MTIVCTAVAVMILGIKTFPIRLETKRLAVSAALAAGLLASVFILRETPSYLFYTIVPLTVCASVAFLFIGRFFDDEELFYFKTVLGRVRTSHRAGAYGI